MARLDSDFGKAFDWEVVFVVNGRPQRGAIGRAGSSDRARDRLIEALGELPQGVAARGRIIRTNALVEGFHRPVAVAERSADGAIHWQRRTGEVAFG